MKTAYTTVNIGETEIRLKFSAETQEEADRLRDEHTAEARQRLGLRRFDIENLG